MKVRILPPELMKNGEYELIVAPENYPGKLYRDRYAYKHRVVWWENTGKLPDEGEVIHHLNENKTDNRFGNLEKLDRDKHARLHGEEQSKTMVELVCPICQSHFVRQKHKTHLVKPSKATYCSRSCIGKASGSSYEEFDQVVNVFEI